MNIFDTLLEIVKSPEFTMNCIDLYESFEYDSLENAIEDLFFFNVDMVAEMATI